MSTRGLSRQERSTGLLGDRLAMPVNEVNATTLAQRQGIAVREVRSEEARDYLSLIELRARTGIG